MLWLSDFSDGVAKASAQKLSDLHISDAMSCATCAIFFDTREEQVRLIPACHWLFPIRVSFP